MSKLTAMNKGLVSSQVLGDLRQLIDAAKALMTRSVNMEMTLLYWHISKRNLDDIL